VGRAFAEWADRAEWAHRAWKTTSRWRELRLLTGWTDRLQFDSAVFRGRRIVMTMDHPHLIIEVRAAEGGDDAKALVAHQVAIYMRLASRRSL
jgi:hypothetical protein